MTYPQNDRLIRGVIGLLALADGAIHLSLNFVLFRGSLFGSAFRYGPRPGRIGAPPGPRANPFILPLNELFLLNFIGAVVLALLFWSADRWLGARRWVMNIVLIAYEAATFTAWLMFGRPNPMGLGYLSKTVELVVIIALAAYTFTLVQSRRRVATGSPVSVS